MVNYDSAKRKLDAFKIEQGEITLIELLPASEPMNILGFKSDPVPEFCHVCVVLTPTATSRIRVEIGACQSKHGMGTIWGAAMVDQQVGPARIFSMAV